MTLTPDSAPPRVDLSTCDREPIHIPGAIQDFGCLIACDPVGFRITRASANAADMVGHSGRDLLGCTLEEIIGRDAVQRIMDALGSSFDPARAALCFDIPAGPSQTRFDVAAHLYGGLVIVEFTPAIPTLEHPPHDPARAILRRLSGQTELDDLCRAAARLLRAALNYDRVMIYRFAADGAGQVIAEDKRSDLESFDGQWFPATDIPAQARALYLKNIVRYVGDSARAPAGILPVLDASGEPLDLSFAHLRCVSPIHCEYLRNMGVVASMSISIVVGGRLWGLVACHQYAPRALLQSERMNAELFGECFSMQVQSLLHAESLTAASQARTLLNLILNDIVHEDEPMPFLRLQLGALRTLLPCDGVALWTGGVASTDAIRLPDRQVRAIAFAAAEHGRGQIWATHHLRSILPGLESGEYDAAGVLAVPLSRSGADYILFVRKAVEQTLQWAGDPNKTDDVGPLGDRLTPRKSFAIWKETVRDQSLPWTADDRAAAEAVRIALMEVIMRQHEALLEERKRDDARQRLLNEELNHRVKNILTLIRSIVRQSMSEDRSLADYAHALEGRIMAMSAAHDQILRGSGGGALSALLDAETAPYRIPGRDIAFDGPDVRLDARAYAVLALVIHELTTNAAKYGSLSAPQGKLHVGWTLREDGSLHMSWVESGGPSVVAPQRKGFGSALLERSIPFDLGGEAELSYAPEGVRAAFTIPSARLQRASAPPLKPAAETVNTALKPLHEKHVLLVEDQLVIALEAEDVLRSLGAATIDVAPNAADALAMIEARAPGLALLDINLGSHTSVPVAEELVRRGVPLIFSTGYGDHAVLPSGLANHSIVRKPFSASTLALAISALQKT
ncbi:MAG: GAF domain-containing protein [Alphaproteobacteria bacterium]|nr:GAF domain-containing protein [Alphaproteobacteria bacterium]